MIDWEKFNMYLQEYDKELILQIIDMYIKEVPEKLSALKTGIDSHDFKLLDDIAHPLKSTSAIFGATEVAALCLKLEMMGKEKVDKDMKGVYQQLLPAIDQLIEELLEYRKTLI